MEFRIADTFTESLARLTGDEQKAAKTTAFDLQINPAHPSLSFHKLDRAKDKNFWSVRVSRDIRLIVHKTERSFLLCYVDHHDRAYAWAEKRKLEVHPHTGAAQLVEIRETVKEVFIPVYVSEDQPALIPRKKKLFDTVSDELLLSYGVPIEWLADVKAADEDTLLVLIDHLPAEAAEALLEAAMGGKPNVQLISKEVSEDPFAHPDAQRRFRTFNNVDELERALEYPWDKWAVFLHPQQRSIVEKDYSGPARVSGSAGTGKTIVALHRAVHLARQNLEARVLLTTYSEILANALRIKLRRLISNEPHLGERIDVEGIEAVGLRLYKASGSHTNAVSRQHLKEIFANAAASVEGHKFSQSFLLAEWDQVVDAWQLKSWEDYRNVKRLGRKTKLPELQRIKLWEIYSLVLAQLKNEKLVTLAEVFAHVALAARSRRPYHHLVIDEAQDLSVYHLRMLAALGGDRPNALFFAGDSGQRIFQQPFSWKALGVSIQGRSKTLTVNYRTSHQIRKKADQLLNSEIADTDGNIEVRDKTVSVFNGPAPVIHAFETENDESIFVAAWLIDLVDNGTPLHEIGIFVRSTAEIPRALTAVKTADLPYEVLDERLSAPGNRIAISTMHLAKGLEFKSVVIMACDDDVIPSQERIDSITDYADLEDVYITERHLLYVACTRARDQLLVTSVAPSSEFLDDIRMS